MELVVANLYKLLLREKGEYIVNDNNSNKILSRKEMVVSKKYVEETNRNSKDNGKLFIIDDAKTKEFHQKLKKKHEKVKQVKEIEKIRQSSVISNALADVVSSKIGNKKTEKIDESKYKNESLHEERKQSILELWKYISLIPDNDEKPEDMDFSKLSKKDWNDFVYDLEVLKQKDEDTNTKVNNN